MTRSTWLWPVIIIGSAIGLSLVVMENLKSPIRPVIALWFLLVCPGMAFARLLRIRDRVREWTLAVALSLVLETILATTMVYARLWSPKGGLGVLMGLSTIGAILQILVAGRFTDTRSGYSIDTAA